MIQTPKSTVYVGATGKDAFSDRLRECAEADGVAVHYMHVRETILIPVVLEFFRKQLIPCCHATTKTHLSLHCFIHSKFRSTCWCWNPANVDCPLTVSS